MCNEIIEDNALIDSVPDHVSAAI